MRFDSVYDVNQWLLGLVSVAMMAGGAAVGAAMGRRQAGRRSEDMGTLESSALGLLALMIGFTFAMSLARFDARRAAVLDEANAIGTTALRARLLPTAQAQAAVPLLVEYTRTRIVRPDNDLVDLRAKVERALALQSSLWDLAVAASQAEPRSVPVGLFVTSLNEMIDMHEKRLIAALNRVPAAVLALLLVVATLALGFAGYSAGIAGKRRRMPFVLTAGMVTVVLLLIIDLDRPQSGLITVSQQALEDTLAGLAK